MGNHEAGTFLIGMYRVAQFFDDVVDRDREVSNVEAYGALYDAMVTLPRNGFYRAHFADLSPIVAVSIMNWRAANAIEREKPDPVSFIIRSSYVDLFCMVALLVGGPEHAAAMTLRVRQWAHDEGFEAYAAEFEK